MKKEKKLIMMQIKRKTLKDNASNISKRNEIKYHQDVTKINNIDKFN